MVSVGSAGIDDVGQIFFAEFFIVALAIIVPLTIAFLTIDLAFFAANVIKI